MEPSNSRNYGFWTKENAITVEVRYSRTGEQYTLLQADGRPATGSYGALRGAVSSGEFGTLLRSLFEPSAGVEFRFRKWEAAGAKRTAVYSFRTHPERSFYTLRVSQEGVLKEVVGLRGEITIDRDKREVVRIDFAADRIPRSFPVRDCSGYITYEYADVSGQRYLLPSSAFVEVFVTRGQPQNWRFRNRITFRDYRKFEADSSITFESR